MADTHNDATVIQETNIQSEGHFKIYKGSENYLPADSREYITINWDNQFKLVKRDFPNVKFFKVGTDLTYEDLQNKIR